jgi:glycosyltransferase involved in cell wall biosynthesis
MADNCKPDVIHLSNALLLGLSHRIREKMNVPVVCSLQDEDVWVDVMKPGTRSAIWNLMHEKSAHVDFFIAVSRFFAEKMAGKMGLPAQKLKTVYLGVDPGEYEFILPSSKPRNIGFISRLCHENGFDLAVDAFLLLKRDPRFRDVKLVATGGSTAADTGYIRNIQRRIREAGLSGDVDFHESFEGNGRTEFFRKVVLGSVPVRNGEAFGFYLTELMASGIPVVQPALGAFPEIIQISGGGVVYEPNTSQKLAEMWAELLRDGKMLDELSIRARKGVEQSFNIRTQASEMVKIYQSLIK